MAQSKVFYNNYANGTIVVVPDWVMIDLRKAQAITAHLSADERHDEGFKGQITMGLEDLRRGPFFTFAATYDAEMGRPWLTGPYRLYVNLVRHLAKQGWQNVFASDLNVPLTEMGMALNAWERPVNMKRAMHYATTEKQFREEFGISTVELLRAAN